VVLAVAASKQSFAEERPGGKNHTQLAPKMQPTDSHMGLWPAINHRCNQGSTDVYSTQGWTPATLTQTFLWYAISAMCCTANCHRALRHAGVCASLVTDILQSSINVCKVAPAAVKVMRGRIQQ